MMDPTSKTVAQALNEVSGPLLREGYDLVKAHLAGQLAMGGMAYLESLVDQQESEAKNAQLVSETVRLYPKCSVRDVTDEKTVNESTFFVTNEERRVTHHTGFEVEYNPDALLKVHGLMDNVIWLERSLGQARETIASNKYQVFKNIFYRSPGYVVGANPGKGLLCATLVSATRLSTYSSNVREHEQIGLVEVSGRAARRLAKYYTEIQHAPDPAAIKELFDPSAKKFILTSKNPAAAVITEKEENVEHVTKLSETEMREYRVLEHLMNLAALFEVEERWNHTLARFTDGVSSEQVQALKALLESRFGISRPQINKASR